ncbi:asparagine synthase (glutamine-hydrolyzing) [Streptomyces parvus]|uniref:asparagine synthase (glutamine-hydrolyzing) n=1 Tax=Streptomyces parvus TaxID=66428 RepID=UPI002101B416|nr:asparagine synthase (glutamine-hydrolyzing) [Streptomyces parvus]MCQ1575871.1 asparagine synthase (glutamine-hydrolyzing) [Streptomyces parvus]
MCGIAGIARIDGNALPEEAGGLLEALACTLAHRGPDDRRLLLDGPVGMAFNRLSLVNPEDGAQPLVSADGNIVLIVNGEVYNHRELAAGLPSGTRLSTGSDCEVLLYLYQRDGLRFLDRVNGMFAFVLWDRARGVLLFGRDRFGIKPLYYHRDNERIVFASEIKALFADGTTPRRIDWPRALGEYDMNATPGFVHGRVTTWFEDIQLVAPGTILEIRLQGGATTEHRYWELPGPDSDSDMTDEDYVETFRDLLAASVADCATADTELGLFLSGGIDSAAVAALAPGRSLQTFTALTPGTVLNGDARGGHRTAELLGLRNHQVLIGSDRVPSPQEWRDLVWLAETPMAGPEVFYKFEMHRFARQNFPGIKGMLLGAAADEINGGYIPNFAGEGGDWDDFESNLRDLHRRQALERSPKLGHWWEHEGVPLLNDAAVDPASPYAGDHYAGYFAWQYRTLEQYNVWHEDRTAAGNGVEARVPFLDHRLVELVARIPARRRAALLWDKRIVRDAMKGILPEEIRTRPKGYFFYGEGARHTNRSLTRMLAQDGAALLEQALSSDNARRYLNADGLRTTLDRLTRSPSTGSIELLLRIVNLGLLEGMTAQLPPPPSQAAVRPEPVELIVEDWERGAPQIIARVVTEPEIDQDMVYALADNVLLATVPAQPDSWFLVVDGSFEYEISAADDAGWLALLRTLDGSLTLAEALAKTDGRLNDVAELLQEAMAVGVLTAQPGTEEPAQR